VLLSIAESFGLGTACTELLIPPMLRSFLTFPLTKAHFDIENLEF
jgi:hypothetical protein